MNRFFRKRGLVSVVVPTLNAGKLLPDLFESVLNQSYKKIEVIINDDKRTSDDSRRIVNNFNSRAKELVRSGQFSELSFRLIKKNIRLGHGRLMGAKDSRGEFIMHLDADMRLTKDIISECVKLSRAGASAIIIKEEVIGDGFWTKCKWLEKRCYWGDDEMESPRFFSAKEYFDVGGHNPKLACSEDKDIDLRFRDKNKKISRTKGFLFHNERRITLVKTFKNKYFWAQSGFDYLKERPKAAWRQVLFIFFRRAYFRNWKFLATHPILTAGMYMLKSAELAGAVFGGLGTKLGLARAREYKTVSDSLSGSKSNIGRKIDKNERK